MRMDFLFTVCESPDDLDIRLFVPPLGRFNLVNPRDWRIRALPKMPLAEVNAEHAAHRMIPSAKHQFYLISQIKLGNHE
jgi:hypothetical protein